MIMNLHDVVERKFYEMSTRLDASLADQGKNVVAQFEASLADRVKDEVRKEFHSYLWSQSLPIQKIVVWLIKRLVRERRWHSKVEVEEVGFVDNFEESDIEPTKQLEVVAKDISNLVDARTEVGFHVQLVESDMVIVEHLFMDDLIVVSGELCVAEDLVVSNEIAAIVSFGM